MAVTLYLIRHGLTQGNLEGRYIGQRENPPLSDRGRRELTERKETHPYPRAEALYTSPLLRCLQTAQILYPMLVPVPLPSLSEQDFGLFEGNTYEQLNDDPAYRHWVDSAGLLPPPGGESGQALTVRLEGALKKIADDCRKSGAKPVAVITHGGCIMAMLSRLNLCPDSSPVSFYGYQAPNGGGFSVELHPDSARISLLGVL